MSWELAGRPLRRVLVTRLRYLGDIAMSTVVLAALRRGDPGLDIGYLCEAAHAPALADHPCLDRLHILGARRHGHDARARARQSDAGGQPTLALIRQLQRQSYDLAVDLYFNPRSALLLWLARIPLRIGGSRSWRRRFYTHNVFGVPPAQRASLAAVAPGGLGTHLCRLAPLRHAESGLPFLEWLVANCGDEVMRPELQAAPLADSRAAAALADLGLRPGDPFVLLAPGATWPTKEWPRNHWSEVITRLVTAGAPAPVVLTAPGRETTCAALTTRTDVLPDGSGSGAATKGGTLPVLPLTEVLRIVAAARLLITVDGGIMHSSVALGRPTLALFGPTKPEIWFPYPHGESCRVLATRPECHPCNRHQCDEFICLPDLSAQTVADTALELLSAAQSEDP